MTDQYIFDDFTKMLTKNHAVAILIFNVDHIGRRPVINGAQGPAMQFGAGGFDEVQQLLGSIERNEIPVELLHSRSELYIHAAQVLVRC